jgi:hypothetical protein
MLTCPSQVTRPAPEHFFLVVRPLGSQGDKSILECFLYLFKLVRAGPAAVV